MTNLCDKPLAAAGLISYRYPSNYSGWIMIGAVDDANALREAKRSTYDRRATIDKLEVWNGLEWVAHRRATHLLEKLS